MRNLVGDIGEIEIANRLQDKLESQGHSVDLKHTNSGKVNRMSWDNRVIFFNKTPGFIGKNIDLIMVDSATVARKVLDDSSSYLMCAEIKSGIDPAGADEHWKTARSALERIRAAFAREEAQCPDLAFVGAAIETAMAVEIYEDLENNNLQLAANLHHSDQMDGMIDWIIRY